jgi:hypothetical protein
MKIQPSTIAMKLSASIKINLGGKSQKVSSE